LIEGDFHLIVTSLVLIQLSASFSTRLSNCNPPSDFVNGQLICQGPIYADCKAWTRTDSNVYVYRMK